LYDVVVIGGGPAGASSAIFLGRAGMRTLLIDDGKRVTKRAAIPNHYGAPGRPTGPDFVENGLNQAREAGVEVQEGRAVGLSGEKGGFIVSLADGKQVETKQIILATGFDTEFLNTAGIEVKEGREPRVKQVAVVSEEGETSKPGIWAAGVLGNVSVHTITTSADGARVAINLISREKGTRWVDHEAI